MDGRTRLGTKPKNEHMPFSYMYQRVESLENNQQLRERQQEDTRPYELEKTLL